ncbi:hypothetical protein ACFE04_024898 [Oxalis oulophora]
MEVDRLSNLPDDLMLDILGRMNIKCAVQTSILSKRWTRLWTRLPTLNLNSDMEFDPESYKDFLYSLFNHYDASNLHTCNFSPGDEEWDEQLVDAVIDYALSNEVIDLTLRCPLNEKGEKFSTGEVVRPLDLRRLLSKEKLC